MSDELRIPRPAEILRRHGIRPRKSLGQHFLVDRAHLARIVGAAELSRDDVALEVGPGLGVLTEALLAHAGQVYAVELDQAMRAIVHERLGEHPRLHLVGADILKVSPSELLADALGEQVHMRVAPRYKVVANLPYYITSAVLRHLLDAVPKPQRLVVMVQREVAERMMAGPGERSVLGVSTQFHAKPTRVAIVPAGAFVPRPRVDSAIVRLDVHATPPAAVDDQERFFRVVRAGFAHRRKQLKNSLRHALDLEPAVVEEALHEANVAPTRRAQTLHLAEWAALTQALGKAADPPADPHR